MFKLTHLPNGNVPPTLYYLGTNAEAYVVGEVLKLTNGRLTKASVDNQLVYDQMFICMKAQAAEATAVSYIPVYEITNDMEFECPSDDAIPVADLDSLALTLNAGATGVTATTTNGVFQARYTDAVSKVRGHFTKSL
jgi:hypothetical protein